MSGILRRTIFYDNTGGFIRFRDFAMVATSLGTMVEPFVANARLQPGTQIDDYDPEDMMARIDAIERIDASKESAVYSGGAAGGGQATQGGVAMSRLGV